MTGVMSQLSKYWLLYYHGLYEMVLYVTEHLSVVRRIYDRWGPVHLPNNVTSILFVCRANVCRSPLAAAYFEVLAKKRMRGVVVRSAGFETSPGRLAHSVSKSVAKQQGLSLDAHLTTQLSSELIDQSDLIVVMEFSQRERICRVYPKARGKTVLLASFDSSGPPEIRDPYGRPLEDFQLCLKQIMRCCDSLSHRLGTDERA